VTQNNTANAHETASAADEMAMQMQPPADTSTNWSPWWDSGESERHSAHGNTLAAEWLSK